MKSLKAVLLAAVVVAGLSSGATSWAGTLRLVNTHPEALFYVVTAGAKQDAGYVQGRGEIKFDSDESEVGVYVYSPTLSWDADTSVSMASGLTRQVVFANQNDTGGGDNWMLTTYSETIARRDEAADLRGYAWKTVLGALLAAGSVWAFRSGIRDGHTR